MSDSPLDRLAESVREAGVAKDVALGFAKLGPEGHHIEWGGDVRRIFDLASLTKPMTAVACARAGLRREPVVERLHETRGSAVEDAPLELALAHRIGLEAHVPLFLRDLEDEGAALSMVAGSMRAECGGKRPTEGHPPLYSDLGYILAGAFLARHAGTIDAGEAIRELVTRPLGLEGELGTARDLRRLLGPSYEEQVAPTEYVAWRGGTLQGVVHDENAWALTGEGGSGHAGMFGTITAVLRFGLHVLEERDTYEWLISERSGGTLRAGFDGKSANGSSAGVKMGKKAFGHLGFTGTSFWIDPEADLVVALLTNRVHPTRENQRIKEARPRVHDALYELAMLNARGGATPPVK